VGASEDPQPLIPFATTADHVPRHAGEDRAKDGAAMVAPNRAKGAHMAEPNVIPLTVRRLKPGTYEQWRKAWDDPENPDSLWPDPEEKAYIARSLTDPDVVVAFGFFSGDIAELMRLRRDPDIERRMQKRVEAMAEFTDELLSDGTYELLEVVTAESRHR
jgi:hypothetical protein